MGFVNNIPVKKIYEVNTTNKKIMKKALESLTFGICIVNESGYISFVNDQFTNLLGITEFESVNRKYYKVFNNELINEALKFKNASQGLLQAKNNNIVEVNIDIMNEGNKYGGAVISFLETDLSSDEEQVIKINNTPSDKNPYPRIITQSPVMIKSLIKAKKASKAQATIMISGESGTGKEVLAKEIHSSSRRSNESFVAVNCGAIPENLIESYLFGHKKGAFTGAINDQIGKFELANGGTIFLDEIGELPLDMQVKLLRVIQERCISKIGSHEIQPINIRIITATNKNLKAMVAEGTFREDLYYRLNIIPIKLVSLRERSADIPMLVEYFKNKYLTENNIKEAIISKKVMSALISYHWPGNIRELKNVVERMIILMEDRYIDYRDLPSDITNYYVEMKQKESRNIISLNDNGTIEPFEVYEKEIYQKAYEIYGSFNATGKALGVTHKTVAAKLRKYNIV